MGVDLLAAAESLRRLRPDLTAALADHVLDEAAAAGERDRWLAAAGVALSARAGTGDGRVTAVVVLDGLGRWGGTPLAAPAAHRLRVELALLAAATGEAETVRSLVAPVLATSPAPELAADAHCALARSATDVADSDTALRAAEIAWSAGDVDPGHARTGRAVVALVAASVTRHDGDPGAGRRAEGGLDLLAGTAPVIAPGLVAALTAESIAAALDAGHTAQAMARAETAEALLGESRRPSRQTALLRLTAASAFAGVRSSSATVEAISDAAREAAAADAPDLESVCRSALGAVHEKEGRLDAALEEIRCGVEAQHRDRQRENRFLAALATAMSNGGPERQTDTPTAEPHPADERSDGIAWLAGSLWAEVGASPIGDTLARASWAEQTRGFEPTNPGSADSADDPRPTRASRATTTPARPVRGAEPAATPVDPTADSDILGDPGDRHTPAGHRADSGRQGHAAALDPTSDAAGDSEEGTPGRARSGAAAGSGGAAVDDRLPRAGGPPADIDDAFQAGADGPRQRRAGSDGDGRDGDGRGRSAGTEDEQPRDEQAKHIDDTGERDADGRSGRHGGAGDDAATAATTGAAVELPDALTGPLPGGSPTSGAGAPDPAVDSEDMHDWMRTALAELDRVWGRRHVGHLDGVDAAPTPEPEPAAEPTPAPDRAAERTAEPPVVEDDDAGEPGMPAAVVVGCTVVVDLAREGRRFAGPRVGAVIRDVAALVGDHLPDGGRLRFDETDVLSVVLPGWAGPAATRWMYRTLPALLADFVTTQDLPGTQLRATVHDVDGPIGAQLLHRLDLAPGPTAGGGRHGAADDRAPFRAADHQPVPPAGGRRRRRPADAGPPDRAAPDRAAGTGTSAETTADHRTSDPEVGRSRPEEVADDGLGLADLLAGALAAYRSI